MEPFFDGDTYRSPTGRKRSVLERVFLSSPRTFYFQIFIIVMKARRRVISGAWNDAFWQQSSVEVLRACERVGMLFHLSGLEHLQGLKGPVVFISNHMSTLETFTMPAVIVPFTKLTFVVKDSLVTHPLFGPIMRSRNPVVVGRKNPREDFATVMREGSSRLRDGYSMVIFPQSTRSEVFRTSDFNSLGVKLAARTDVPVVPVAVRTDAWGNGTRLKDFGPVKPEKPVRMCFGPPRPVHGKGSAEHETVTSFITERLRGWGVPVEH